MDSGYRVAIVIGKAHRHEGQAYLDDEADVVRRKAITEHTLDEQVKNFEVY